MDEKVRNALGPDQRTGGAVAITAWAVPFKGGMELLKGANY
jgi:hypothetical protein